MTRLPTLPACLMAASMVACATSPATHSVPPEPASAEARWVEGPEAGIQTLLLSPTSVTSFETSGDGEVEVSVGAFYTRWEQRGATMDQLALLVQLEGDDLALLERAAGDIRLIMDGELYQGHPVESPSGRFREPRAGRHRLSVAVPICSENLRTLIEARDVRGQLGPSPVFRIPVTDRRRMETVLRHVPDAGPALGSLYKVTETD